ncbi:hypothetical protein [Sulfurimonas sp.]
MIDTNLLFNSLSNAYEEVFMFLFILFSLGVLLHIFHEKFADTYREQKKLLNFASSMIAVPIVMTIGYIVMKGYLIWLIVGVVTLIMMLLYRLGMFDELLHHY